MEGAMSASEVSNALGLSALKSRTWSIFKTSATKGEGLDEAMEWWVDERTFSMLKVDSFLVQSLRLDDVYSPSMQQHINHEMKLLDIY